MKRIIISFIFVLVCGSSFANEVNSPVISKNTKMFRVQSGDNCHRIGARIQNNQCKDKIIQFISSKRDGTHTMCVWHNGNWHNGTSPPEVGGRGYFNC